MGGLVIATKFAPREPPPVLSPCRSLPAGVSDGNSTSQQQSYQEQSLEQPRKNDALSETGSSQSQQPPFLAPAVTGAARRHHLLDPNSPSPSPLTPTIEALLWKLDLVDNAGCDLAALCEEGQTAASAAQAASVAASASATASPLRHMVESPATIAPSVVRNALDSRRSSNSSDEASDAASDAGGISDASNAMTETSIPATPRSSVPVHLQREHCHSSLQRRRSRSNSHSELAKTAVGLREIARKIGRAQLIWDTQPKTVLIVTKLHDEQLVRITHQVAKYLVLEIGLTALVEDTLKDSPAFDHAALLKEIGAADEEQRPKDVEGSIGFWNIDFCANPASAATVDFCITLGGDGTVLYAAWLFQQKCPPILPYRLGSLGFLTTFDFAAFRASVRDLVLETGLTRGLRMNFRMRFSCTVIRHDGQGEDHGKSYEILNDLTIDRGPSPFMSQLELYGNENHLTTIHADGLTISTPTGSTAYSLSSGGSLVHPDVSAILVTPICPHTLSFRPMILPDTMEVRVAVPEDSRATAFASFDGRRRVCLGRGDAVVVKAGTWPVPTVCWEDQSKDWFKGLERCLGWNKRERQKGLLGGGDSGMEGVPW
ncbi:hypothetical protein HKX48_001189 [Thoreauomyces humboldtii]|nr:hypothetical protein HKX48_001189 [Thoreauomyces humboldtii]